MHTAYRMSDPARYDQHEEGNETGAKVGVERPVKTRGKMLLEQHFL